MTETEKLKLLLGIPSDNGEKDDLLRLLLEQARGYLLTYCRRDTADESMTPLIVQMAAEDYGRLGGEGVSFRTASGASESYRGEYSPRIIAALRRLRRMGGPLC